MMDDTDIKAGEAKLGELKGNMDAINAARRKGGCVAGTRRFNVKIVGLLPALATAEWSFNRLTRVIHRQLISPPGQKEGL
ncbi:hypothetical protein NKH81_34000 [Mesorhizobium sp. M0959]|uniref:hypothetical protein n=1 Tax=Mesorhizobium sp. M0959 TaxID=2957034 RepID=UPI00333A0148